MTEKSIKVRIITPFGVYKETEASIVNFRSNEGQRGLLANHMPLVTIIPVSQIIMVENGVRETYAVGNGMLYFRDNLCRILVDVIENKKDIDKNRAILAKERALSLLENKKESTDLERAELSLKKAINRLNTIGEN